MKDDRNFPKWIYFLLAAGVISLGLLAALNLGESQKTLPIMTLSYFTDNQEITTAIVNRLHHEIMNSQSIFIGVEPEKTDQISLAVSFKNEIEKINGKFDAVILDEELKWSIQDQSTVNANQKIYIKDDFFKLKQFLSENENKKILVISASIYTTNLLHENPLNKIRMDLKNKPLIFSMAYFPIDIDDEKNSLFPCLAEDKSGIRDWGCAAINKARSVRRKINLSKFSQPNPKHYLSVMDLTGENEYMILFKKQN